MPERLIRLSWPPSKTSSNGSQGDWRGKANAAKAYKQACAWECVKQAVKPIEHEWYLPVEITYHPPREGRVDWDNISNRAKQGFDAVAEAIGVDDGRWWPVTLSRGPKIKGGCVLVHIGKNSSVDLPVLDQVIGDKVVK